MVALDGLVTETVVVCCVMALLSVDAAFEVVIVFDVDDVRLPWQPCCCA